MTERKKLIEVALPLEAINEASAREKSIRHGHPSTLHLWWARRPLAACRAVIFTSLVDDPDNPNAPAEFVAACQKLPKGKNAAENDTPRQRLFDFIERLVTWEATTDEEILEKARELIRLCTDGNPPPLLDPFAGGGSIPLEAQRLGLEAHASDLNPVAVMINKAMIEIPPLFKDMPPVNPRDRERFGSEVNWKGANGLAADVRYYGEWMKERAWEQIGHLYPKCNGETVVAWLWARTVICPNPACKKTVPLIRSLTLSKKKGHYIWLEPVATDEEEIGFVLVTSKNMKQHFGTIDRRGAKCISCETPVSLDYIRNEGQKEKLGSQLLAIVTDSERGREYYVKNHYHEKIAKSAKPKYKPDTKLLGKARVSVPLYGMETHGDLYSDRQLIAMSTFSDLIYQVKNKIYNDGLYENYPCNNGALHNRETGSNSYAEAIQVYLSFALDRAANYWSTLTFWADFIVQTFSRQALPMVWDYSEANPFSESTGNWMGAIDWIAKCLEYSISGFTQGYASQRNAMKPYEEFGPIPISTDPPYYDNIEYADLSDYFYIWMRKTLKNVYPDLFNTILVPKSDELIASPFRYPGGDNASKFFEDGLRNTFKNIRKVISLEIPFTVFYAYKQEEITIDNEVSSTGWETMLKGLIDSDFQIVGTWPIRTERDQGMKTGSNVLASSIVLVCRPRTTSGNWITRQGFVTEIRDSLPRSLKEMLTGNIAPVDLSQAVIGPGMAVYTSYDKVLEPDGSELSVRTALQLINQVLDEYLTEQEGEMDEVSRFAVAWFEQFGFEKGPFGQADVLARAKNTSVEGMANNGILEAEAGQVRLLGWDELDPGLALRRDMVWAATHLLIERLNTYGETGAAELLAGLSPDLAANARQLAYRLYSIADRKGWSALARNYNALVISWNESQSQAQDIRKGTERQARLFGDT
ncbi:MAG TPA: DUF1156 domain-containing protein [Brevefilum sp.]|nr:DUF1156 domain-containing protein [Brevefilum sp.]